MENSRKVPLDRHDIIIDKVAASHDNNYVVAVTSNNMVRIFFSLWDHPDITSAKGLGGLVSGSKGQLISKANFQAVNSSKKRTNEFVFTSMRLVFVNFLEEI